jgi:hypothetical protein
MKKLCFCTTTRYLDDPVSSARAPLALKTAEEVVKLNNSAFMKDQGMSCELFVVDGGSSNDFQEKIRSFCRGFAPEYQLGMGAGRRQLFRMASRIYGDEAVYLWLEPEKWEVISSGIGLIQPILLGEADLVSMFRDDKIRKLTYPPEQYLIESTALQMVAYLLGDTEVKFDLWSGVFAVNFKGLQKFLEYGGEYGNDTWDANLVPTFKIVAGVDGLRAKSIEVPYFYPAEQAVAEIGRPSMCAKRIEQLRGPFLSLWRLSYDLGLASEAPPPMIY